MTINEIKKKILLYLASYAAIKKKKNEWEGKEREEIEGNVPK